MPVPDEPRATSAALFASASAYRWAADRVMALGKPDLAAEWEERALLAEHRALSASEAAVPAVLEDEPYRSGWLGGFEHCRASYQRIQHSVNMLFGPP